MRLTSDATITSANANGSATNISLQTGGAVPVDGTLHLAYDRPRSLLSISHSYLKTPHTTLNLDGTVSSHSSLSVQANITDLQEADLLVLAVKSALAPSQKGQASPPFSDIHGAGNLNVQVTGSLQNPKISGSLSATNLQTGSIRLRTVRTNLEASPSEVILRDGEIAEANTGRVSFDATVGLNHWAFSQASPVTAQVTADRMPVADLQEIANLHYPVAGNLSAKISASGSVLNPGGQGSLQLTQATIYNQAVQNLTVQFQGTGASIHSTANLRLPAGTITADVTYAPKAKSYEVKLDTSGLKLDQLPALQTRGQITGTLIASVNGRGTLAQPQLTLSASVKPLQVRDQVIQQLQAHADLAGRQVNFTLQSEVANNTIQATGGVNLSGAYDANVTLDTKPFPIGEFLAMYVPGAPDQLQGQTEIHATLRGPLKDPARFEAHVSLPNLSIAYGPLQFASAQPIRVDFQNDVVTLAPAEFKGNGTDLRIQGSVPIKGTGQLNASAHGTVEMGLLKLVQKNADSAGQITLDVEARGDRAHPSVQGKIQFANASYSTPTIPIGFEKVNGSVGLQGNRLQITQLTAQAGGGTINASGFAILGSAMTINLTADAEDVRVRYPRGVRAVLDGRLTWTGTSAASAIGGNMTIRRLSFTNQFDLSSFVTQFTGEAVPSNSSAFEQNTRLNIGIQSSNELQLASTQLSLQGAANLRLTGTLANPIVLRPCHAFRRKRLFPRKSLRHSKWRDQLREPRAHRARAESLRHHQRRSIQHHHEFHRSHQRIADELRLDAGLASGGHHQFIGIRQDYGGAGHQPQRAHQPRRRIRAGPRRGKRRQQPGAEFCRAFAIFHQPSLRRRSNRPGRANRSPAAHHRQFDLFFLDGFDRYAARSDWSRIPDAEEGGLFGSARRIWRLRADDSLPQRLLESGGAGLRGCHDFFADGYAVHKGHALSRNRRYAITRYDTSHQI